MGLGIPGETIKIIPGYVRQSPLTPFEEKKKS